MMKHPQVDLIEKYHSIFYQDPQHFDILEFPQFYPQLPVFSDTIINCCINHLVYLVCRNYSSVNNSAEYNVKRVKKPEEIVYEIINFIDNNTRSIKKLNELSNYLGYNYSYISALFSRQTGQNIKEYFDEKRISLACELLSHGYSITDTAYELNFESVQSFNRAFKRIMGVSPGNFNHKTSRD